MRPRVRACTMGTVLGMQRGLEMGSRYTRREGAAARRCSSCTEPLDRGATLCACGTPTELMSFEDRTRHEVERWRSYQASRVS